MRAILTILFSVFILGTAKANFTWQALGGGLSSQVLAMEVVSENEIYAGGQFLSGSGNSLLRIARWNGSEWLPLGGGVNRNVLTIAKKGNDLYVGGEFITAGGDTVNRIARWDGTNWHPLGNGFNNRVTKILFHGDDLYAIGFFTMSGNTPVRQIARWDGVTWHPLGSGVSMNVNAMAIADDGTVYVGGLFFEAGGNAARSFAKWDGNTWTEVGGGVRGMINEMTSFGNDIYIAGSLDSAGPIAVNRIAKWDGNSWTSLDHNLTGSVRNLLVINSDEIYAGGYHSPYGSLFAKWDGNTWTFPAPYLNSFILSIKKLNDNVYAAGQFNYLGNTELKHIAQLIDRTLTNTGNSNELASGFELYQNFPNPFNPVTKIRYSIANANEVTLRVYDMLGREVRMISEGFKPAGEYSIEFNASDLSSGVYYYRLQSGETTLTKKMTLVR